MCYTFLLKLKICLFTLLWCVARRNKLKLARSGLLSCSRLLAH